jgi:hypothetical protein
MLAFAKDLKHFYFRTDVEEMLKHDRFVTLYVFIFIAEWPRLKYFRLSGFIIRQSDMLNILAIMLKILKEVNLSFLDFLDKEFKEGSRGI